jgi:succinate dehydrogenase / fumarate reductase cytochrome b subunit
MVMAGSGILFVLFVLMHMYGNLKAFAGAESFNTYAHHLRTLGEPILPYEGFLWIFRLVMLGALVVHVASAASLWRRANGARSSRDVVKKAKAATLSSKWMRWGGITLLAFIIFHLLQFTTNTIRVNGDHAEPYQRMVAGFQPWWVVVIYLIALASLGMHLRHGVWSACQTLGLVGNAQAKKTVNTIAILVAVVVALGFAAVPLAVLGGLIS